MEFSEKLKEIRKSNGLSQEQLAEKIGVSRQAITKWETGRSLPDIENMKIIVEIFKTTLDELLVENMPLSESNEVYSSETVYDIDMNKHFDMDIGNAGQIVLSSGADEKLHIKLESNTLENIGQLFKIRLDEKKSKLDVKCECKDKISRFEAEDAIKLYITLPDSLSDECEISASVKKLTIDGLKIRKLEYDGDAEKVDITKSSGSLEFTGKKDYDITIDSVSGRLDINQWKAQSIVHISESNCPKILNRGRKCEQYFSKDGKIIGYDNSANDGNENVISMSGILSELVIDLL